MTDGEKMVWAAAFVAALNTKGMDRNDATRLADHAVDELREAHTYSPRGSASLTTMRGES